MNITWLSVKLISKSSIFERLILNEFKLLWSSSNKIKRTFNKGLAKQNNIPNYIVYYKYV